MNKSEIRNFVEDLCYDNYVELLYLTKVGSHLYGLNTENSDIDYRFIFLPLKESLLLGKRKNHITYSTGENGTKNDSKDVDVQGWSLHYFFELLNKGDSNAIDLLYSFTNLDSYIVKTQAMKDVFENHQKFYDVKKCVNNINGFANSQAKKYGIRGDRLKIFRDLFYDEHLKNIDQNDKLGNHFDYILQNYEGKFCKVVTRLEDYNNFLKVCDGLHQESITIGEFMNRMMNGKNQYGERSKKAMLENGNDFKALSHTYRCFHQSILLMSIGKIEFPFDFAERKIMMNIKEGNYSNEKILELVKQKSDDMEYIYSNHQFENKQNKGFMENFILSFYL